MASLLKPWITRYLDAEGKQVKKGTARGEEGQETRRQVVRPVRG